jgi:hypothetical protein
MEIRVCTEYVHVRDMVVPAATLARKVRAKSTLHCCATATAAHLTGQRSYSNAASQAQARGYCTANGL